MSRKPEYVDVMYAALEETRDKFERYWKKDPEGPSRQTLDAVNFALGLFSGIVVRRLKGDPDPDPHCREGKFTGSKDIAPPGRNTRAASKKKAEH